MKIGVVLDSKEGLSESWALVLSLLEKIAAESAIVNPVLLGMRKVQRALDEQTYHEESWRTTPQGVYSFDNKSACPIDHNRRMLLRELYYDWEAAVEGPDEILFRVMQELCLARPLSRSEEDVKNYVGPRLNLELARRIRGKLSALDVHAKFAGYVEDGEFIRARLLVPGGFFSDEDIRKYGVVAISPQASKDKGLTEYSIQLDNLRLFFVERSGADSPIPKQ